MLFRSAVRDGVGQRQAQATVKSVQPDPFTGIELRGGVCLVEMSVAEPVPKTQSCVEVADRIRGH